MRVVAALGGNALLRRGEVPELSTQRAHAASAARALAPLAGAHELVLTHGNGPQIGLLALQAEAIREPAPASLDVLGAESDGLIGHLLLQAVRQALPGREVVCVLTQVEVDPADPAFDAPSKPIGPIFPRAQAERLARERGWSLQPDGDGLRRSVASPEPRDILELPTLRRLVAQGVVLICAGGGGIPVARPDGGALEGIEAVVDKDLTSALLAQGLGAELLLLLTDVPAVFRDFPACRDPIRSASPEALRRLALPPGSMGPKAEAACRFAESGGIAVIGALEEAPALVAGTAGTRVQGAGVSS